MAFEALSQILAICQKESIDFAEAVLREDSKDRLVDREASIRQMTAMWESMCDASDSYDVSRKSNSGLVGGAGGVMADYVAAGNTLCGDAMGRVIAQALQMGESNACMKRIVAAPTAGACGVLPAVLIPLFRDDPNTIRALFVAAGIGQVIATRASIAGASGGCQAEIGSASAMAAGALVYLRGGSCEQILAAVAMSLKNLLGLVCDPVSGLVEVPCVKRNVIGAVNAMSAADMALAGIQSMIPADQVIDAMKEVGDLMDVSLRETGRGGLAATRRGVEIRERLQGEAAKSSKVRRSQGLNPKICALISSGTLLPRLHNTQNLLLIVTAIVLHPAHIFHIALRAVAILLKLPHMIAQSAVLKIKAATAAFLRIFLFPALLFDIALKLFKSHMFLFLSQ